MQAGQDSYTTGNRIDGNQRRDYCFEPGSRRTGRFFTRSVRRIQALAKGTQKLNDTLEEMSKLMNQVDAMTEAGKNLTAQAGSLAQEVQISDSGTCTSNDEYGYTDDGSPSKSYRTIRKHEGYVSKCGTGSCTRMRLIR